MPSKIAKTSIAKTSIATPSVGLLGFGAFGRLVAAHLHPHFPLVVYDRSMLPGDRLEGRVQAGDMAAVGRCDVVILAVPVREFPSAIKDLRPFLRPGSVVVDVASVKVNAVRAMEAELPPFVDIVGTHPLFGPQSAREGIRGLKIVVCPVRGRSAPRIAAFLRSMLGLKVFVTTPEEHDREVAVVQGVTHLIANVLVRMEPLPTRLTTASFDCLMQATEMVRYDAASVFRAIACDNPFAAEIRERFFNLAQEARAELDDAGISNRRR